MPSLLARLLTRSFPAKAEARTARASDPEGSDAGGDGGASVAYESRALRLWYESRAGGKRSPSILDLGRLHPDSLRFFQSVGARISVMALDTEVAGTGFELQLQEQVPWTPVDGVLVWDLANYLEAEELRALGRWLAQQSESGTMVLVCLATHSPYPQRPGQYAILGEAELCHHPDPQAVKTRRVLHSSHELVKLWPQFAAVRSFLLRSGMQEFVLRRR